jgi:AbrB family looped-hinge helix DNA binding protein
VIATISSRGQIVIPQVVRERCGIREGDHFVAEDDAERKVITLRKVRDPGAWFDVYMECPHSFKLPVRRKQYDQPKHELAR